ncbi:MAG TPA: PH domain-containing protein [Mycobacterium sp.]|nr:PH domain-containing protein [Mycobacterium sp.]
MQQTDWGPNPVASAACGLLGIVMCVSAVTLVTDPPGRLLVGIAAVGLLVFAGFSFRARPKLAITPGGLVVRGWWRARTVEKPAIKLIRITEFRRLARKVRLLEVDTVDGRLLVFSRWDLGTDPLNVLDALTEAGYC